MPNILLTTLWLGGDVFPFLELAVALKARGHNVTLISNCNYASSAQRAGVNFAAIDRPEEFNNFLQDSHLFNTPNGFIEIYKRYALPTVLTEYRKIAELHREGETLIVARSMPAIA